MKRGLNNVSRLRRTLRRMPEEIQKDVKRAIQDGMNQTHRAVAQEIPVDEGDLRDALLAKRGRDGLSAKIGYTPKWKRAWRKAGWRAHLILFGTKGGTVKSGSGKGNVIPPQPPNNFMARAWSKVRQPVLNRIISSVNRALERVANG